MISLYLATVIQNSFKSKLERMNKISVVSNLVINQIKLKWKYVRMYSNLFYAIIIFYCMFAKKN
jgi:hypothetical protein